MLYNWIHDLFRKSPDSLRKLVTAIPIRYRLGGDDFSSEWQLLQRSEQWGEHRLKQLQRDRLSDLLQHAVDNVPYYSDIELFHDNPFDNLQEFPIITKKDIQENRELFQAVNIPDHKTHEVTTGGTSGNPFRFRLDNSVYGREWAFIMTGWKRVGYSPGDKMVSFRGVEFPDADKGVYWQFNPFYNSYEMSPFHMNDATLPRYIEKIQSESPRYIHGYPSAITTLASYVKQNDITIPSVQAIFAASENIYDHQRKLMEDVFDVRVFSHYGLSEKAILAAECEQNTTYHVYPQYCVPEVVDSTGEPVSHGETGEILGTSLLNYSMPFIRYQTGDMGSLSPDTCECGRAYPIFQEVTGKNEKELPVVKDDGTTFPLHSLYYTMHGDTLENVYSVQFYQEQPGEIEIRVEVTSTFDDVDKQRILEDVRRKCGNQINATLVKGVELTDSGKQKLFIRNIDS
ncbi:phenylacetate--CoA ligase family protein [Halorubrum miltondacostae]|uniref:AMP-binding protein n=1 Tax=Halorubrum miltondacostae TaxID=3076378 RepID=A0ABD5MAT5_9EURY